MTETEYKTIKTEPQTKIRFDQFQFDLKKKGIIRSQDQLVNIMINISIEHIKENCKTIGDLKRLTEQYKNE
jgi:hypothetical protein